MPVVDGKALAPPKDEVFVVGRLPTAMKKNNNEIKVTYYSLVKILAVQVLVVDKKSVVLVGLFEKQCCDESFCELF